MIIKNVQLHNYGPFKGSHSIDLAQPSIKRVTLIGGLNGSGKTSIFEAIQLCLFGNQSNLHKENRRAHSYSKFLEAKVNRDTPSNTRCAINLTLNLGDDTDITEDIILERSWTKTTKGTKESFEVTRNGMVDVVLSENWIEFISTIISPALSKLFLFDGEKILKYAEPAETSKLLIQGIETLIGADLITNLEEDLALLKKNILKDTSPDLQSELTETEEEIDEHKKRLNKDGSRLQKLKDKNEVTKKIYEEYGSNFSKGRGRDNNIVLYFMFSLCLSIFYCSTKNIKYLSTLLKITDLICSIEEKTLNQNFPLVCFGLILLVELLTIKSLSQKIKEVNFEFA